MLDYLHLPDNTGGTVDYFPGFSNTDGGSWVVWVKPRGAHMIRITCIAGAGGGGSGYSGSGGGGGGGGSSAISIVTLPAYVLPDRLYVSSGIGGEGATTPSAGTATLGNNGIRSYVSIAQDTGAIYCVCYADSGKAGTTAATSSAGGSGGSGGIVATIANMLLASHGIRNFIAGQDGATGSSPIQSSTLVYPSTGLLLSGGAGGAGPGNAFGGAISAPTQTQYVIFSTPPNNTNIRSSPGVEIYQPLLSTGGWSSAIQGDQGGAGGFGSGGAGSKGGTAAGGGGQGGNGLVIIHSW